MQATARMLNPSQPNIEPKKASAPKVIDGALGVPITALAVDNSYAVTICSPCSIFQGMRS